jgi:hypothetical protein
MKFCCDVKGLILQNPNRVINVLVDKDIEFSETEILNYVTKLFPKTKFEVMKKDFDLMSAEKDTLYVFPELTHEEAYPSYEKLIENKSEGTKNLFKSLEF